MLFECLAATPAIAEENATQRFVVAGYLPSYRINAWDPTETQALTDVIYFNAIPEADGSLPASTVSAQARSALSDFRRATSGRVAITVGGWGHSEIMSAVCQDQVKRKRLVEALVELCKQTAIDSVDFDWEHPESPAQWKHYLQLIRETHDAVRPLGGICTLALAPWNEPPSEVWEVADRIHLMSYDHAYPHATLKKSTADLERVIGWGCPKEKLVLGIPFYGRAKEWKATTYATLVAEDLVAGNPVDDGDMATNGVAFNGPKTVGRKVRLAKERGLAGIMIWEIGQDTPDSDASLLNAIRNTLLERESH